MRTIGKKLITKNNLSDKVSNGAKEVFITPDMILTSEAIDILRNRGIAIHYAKEKCGVKDLSVEIETVLRNEFGINQEAQLKQITELVLKKI